MTIPRLNLWSLGTLLDGFLPKSGGTMTGDLTLASAPDADLKAATKKYVDDAVGGAASPVATVKLHKDGTNQASFAGDTAAKITWNTAAGGGSSWFNDANDQIVIPADGVYRILGQITFTTGIADGNLCVAYIFRNGGAVARRNITSPGTSDITIAVDDDMELTAGDTIELQGFKAGSGTAVFGNAQATFLRVTRLR